MCRSFCHYFCFCFKCLKKSKRSSISWRNRQSVTPSDITDSQLAPQFRVPGHQFQTVSEVFELRGYDFDNREILARGGFATVYKIKKKVKKVFALKEIALKSDEYQRDPKKFENLKSEIFVISKLKHKNIIQLMDCFIINNTCYLIMAFANSGTVENEITKLGPINESKAKTYFIQMANAIAFLHDNRPPIAHRDIKLANILIHIENKQKLLKLTDFGFSKVLSEKYDRKVFRARFAEGTIAYMSPQMLNLILHRRITDPKTKELMKQLNIIPRTVNPIKADIWSLGVCLYVMICAKLPFDIESQMDKLVLTVKKQMQDKRNAIDKRISLQLNDLLNRMLNPKTDKRTDISGVLQHSWLFGVSDVISL